MLKSGQRFLLRVELWTLVIFSWPGAAAAEEGLEVDSETGAIVLDVYGGAQTLLKLAVPRPVGDGALPEVTRGILTRDLELSSLFQILDQRSFSHLNESGPFDAEAWRTVDAQAVVRATTAERDAQVQLELGLHEVGDGAGEPVLRRSFAGPSSGHRQAVHDFANEVIRHYTGQPGVFGSRILFARSLGRGRKAIYTVGMDGEGLSAVTGGEGVALLPSWGPGGSILYTLLSEGRTRLMRSGSRAPVLAERGLNMGAALAPGGGRMAVVLSRDGNSEIYLVNADGTGLRNLTRHPSIDVSPAWSPDGSQIAFVSNRHGSPQVFVMGADGGSPRRVTFAGAYNQTPSFCPRADTPRLVYTGEVGGGFDIFTVGVDGRGLARLTQSQGSNSDPAWSPDGRLIAFWSSRGGIHLMNAEGLNQQLVLRGHAESLRWAR